MAAQLARHKRHRRLGTVTAVTLAIIAAVVTGTWWWMARPEPPSPRTAAQELAAAWSAGDPSAGPVTRPGDVAEWYPPLVAGLEPTGVEVAVGEVGDPGPDGVVDVQLRVTWGLGDGHELAYDTTAGLVEDEGDWLVDFASSVVHPSLGDDGRLVRRRHLPDRADIVGQGGQRLVTNRPVVHVGVEPARVSDLQSLTATLGALLDVDAKALAARVEQAADNAFVPVVTLRGEDYDRLGGQLQPLRGTVFRRDELPLAPTREFARPILGAAGPVTAEVVEEHPERYQAGDVAGLSGLQRRFDERLTGLPGFEILAIPGDSRPDEVLLSVGTEPGHPIEVTLDERTQLAAEAALADIDHPSALVAIRISDGHVLAAANGPGNGGQDLAISGQLPPGSTFKVVTTAALLNAGLDPDSNVPCAQTATVDGRSFRNAERASLGDVPFSTAFAESCNTSFIELAAQLDDEALSASGRRFGLGLADDLGVGAYRGQVPTNDSDVDKAAASIGQGRNLVSPLALADVAATVARGHHLPPRLLVDPAPEPPASATPDPLAPAVADTLRRLMRAVVTDGSGGALAQVAGGPVHGKTGTAEYGEERPPRTHAWFIAYQGDIALSVLVAETADGFGGRLAAPVAADFLRRLAGEGS